MRRCWVMAWGRRRIDGRDIDETVKSVQMRKLRQFYAMLDGAACRPAAVRRYFGARPTWRIAAYATSVRIHAPLPTSPRRRKKLFRLYIASAGALAAAVVDHLLGKTKNAFVSETSLSTFGIGREFAAGGWRDLIDQLLFEGLLREDANDGRPLIGLGEADEVRAVYRGERRVSVRKMPTSERSEGNGRSGRSRKRRDGDNPAVDAADAALFAALRAWRRERASEQHVPNEALTVLAS
jgi:ATP-dependent DNA helicase RecQ